MPAPASQQRPHPQRIQLRLTRLIGLAGFNLSEPLTLQECPNETDPQECVAVFEAAPPDFALPVDEALVRSWAAEAAQLQLLFELHSISAAPVQEPAPPATGKRVPLTTTQGAAGRGGSPASTTVPAPVPAQPPLATGSLQLDCAPLLLGDTSCGYQWPQPQLQQQQQQRWAVPCAPPKGDLECWLLSAHVTVQVC